MAVVLILGLTMALLIPAFGAGAGTALRRQGERLGGTLELARQRAVMTGKPHRVVINLEQGHYAIEWLVTAARAEGGLEEEVLVESEQLDAVYDEGIDLTPPRDEFTEYYPIPNRFGGHSWLDAGFFFEGIDTPEGWIESGEVVLVFDWDGSSDVAQIVISDPDNRSIDLDIAPIVETVRIREEES